jgi:hypothetical protein
LTLDLTHLGAFLSGAAAILSAVASSRLARKRYRAECAERIEEVKASLIEGYRMGRE